MNIKVVSVYVAWIILCFWVHSTFGGFCLLSGMLEGWAGIGLASIFWTRKETV